MNREPVENAVMRIDVTETARNHLNTGIQRVVRCLSEEVCRVAPGSRMVVWRGGSFELFGGWARNARWLRTGARVRSYLREVIRASKGLLVALVPVPWFRVLVLFPRRMGSMLLRRMVRVRGRKGRVRLGQEATVICDAIEDDLLVLMDSTWNTDLLEDVARRVSRGQRVVVVVYDLLPLSVPHCFDDSLPRVFEDWFRRVCQIATGFVCISRTVAVELEARLRRKGLSTPVAWFRLGGDLPVGGSSARIRSSLSRWIGGVNVTTFLMVGTLEPRKNHLFVLEAFRRLVAAGADARLLLVGRMGWKSDDLIGSLYLDETFQGRVRWLRGVTDEELVYCYRNANALICASIAEGFGLPIVEGLAMGVHVIASDIPIHREAGGEAVRYFGLEDPDELVAAMKAVCDSEVRGSGVFSNVVTWRESAQSFLLAVGSVSWGRSCRDSPRDFGDDRGKVAGRAM